MFVSAIAPQNSFKNIDNYNKKSVQIHKQPSTFQNQTKVLSFSGYGTTLGFLSSLFKTIMTEDSDNVETSGKTYLEYINNLNDDPRSVANILTNFVGSELHRKPFIEELTKEPAKSKEIISLLVEKLGGKTNFLKWYLGTNGYVKNYERYLKDKYENASNISELIKLQPNWGYWALERKQLSLDGYTSKSIQDEKMRDMKANFTFGDLPADFINKNTFNSLIEKLKSASWMYYGYIYAYNTLFNVKQLEGGDLSSKNIFKVTINNRNYIIKMDRFYPEEHVLSSNGYNKRNMKEGRLLRGDSVYLDACIDYYLQQNGCNSNAKLLFYDFKNNASIYEYIDANEIKHSEALGLVDQIEANKLFKDLNNMGIYLNDIGMTFNCYKDKNENMRIIDVGHAEYVDLLKPGGNLLTVETSNLCGFSLKNAIAGLYMDKLGNITNEYTSRNELQSSKKQNLSSVEIPEAFEIDANNYLSNELKKADYTHARLYNFTITKDKLKRQLKYYKDVDEHYTKNSLTAENKPDIIKHKLDLIEFYKKSLLARHVGLLDNNKSIIDGILNAIKRELKLVRTTAEDIEYIFSDEEKQKIYDYRYFYTVYKKGNNL